MYSIQERDGRRFLHAAARGLGIQAALQHEWDLTAYEIDPRTVEIRIAGEPLPPLPDEDLPLNRRYFLM